MGDLNKMDINKFVDELLYKEPKDRSFTVFGTDTGDGKKRLTFVFKEPADTVSDKQAEEAIWKRLQATIKESKNRKDYFNLVLLKIAAATVILLSSIGTYSFLFSVSNEITESQKGSVSNLAVSPNFDLTMNSASYASIGKPRTSIFGAVYNLELEGEFLIKLENENVSINVNDQTTISSSDGIFNFYNRNGLISVTSFDAFVEIIYKGITKTINPGNTLEFSLTGIMLEPTLTSLEHFGSWVNGEFYFTDRQLSFILLEVERQFGVSIILRAQSTLITTHFSKSEGFEKSIDKILYKTPYIQHQGSDDRTIFIDKGIS